MPSTTRKSRRLIGLASDRPGTGKSTAANYLIAKHGFSSISIGALVKSELDAMVQIYGFRYREDLKEEFRPGLSWWTEFRIKYSSPDYWLDKAMNEHTDQESLIIPDLRYPNEAQYVKLHDGITIKIERPDAKRSLLESEVALDDHPFDYTIDNSRNDGGAAMFVALEQILNNMP